MSSGDPVAPRIPAPIRSGQWLAAYRENVRETFRFLKHTTALDQLMVRAIAFSGGWLVPVADLHLADEATVAALGRWRAEHMSVHPTQFPVTPAGTRKWLADGILADDDRLLLLVSDQLGRPVGHIGFSSVVDSHAQEIIQARPSIELGYVLRGEAAAPDLMAQALSAGLRWVHEVLAPAEIYALTFEDNDRALAFFRRCGATRRGTIPLIRRDNGERLEFRPADAGSDPSVDKRFVVLAFPDRAADDAAGQIGLAGPSITAREAAYALDAARTGWGARRSGYLDRLAKTFATAVGARYALPTSSCTGAMHLALLARGIGPGDEVVVPDLTWVATANAVALTGATPVFADVECGNWGLAPDALRASITTRTRAVIPVHLYGYPARVDALGVVADEHGLFVLHDAAAAVGSSVHGRPIGCWKDMAAFSFQGAKLLVAGEGGILVTDDGELFERAAHLLDQARGSLHPFHADEVTPKYKMSNVQAAVALAQVERMPWLVALKRRVHDWYRDELEGIPGLALHAGDPASTPSHWMTCVTLQEGLGVTRDHVLEELRHRGIDVRPTFPALSSLPMWRPQQPSVPVAAEIAAQGINLPSGVRLRRDDIARVGDALRGILGAPP